MSPADLLKRLRRRPARATHLPFAPPTIGEDEIAAVADALRSGWITTGPRVAEFEERFAAFVGAPRAIALSSCSAGLHTALAVAGIGAGDAVITTPLTFAATVNAIEHVGARPILVDVDPATLNLSPDRVADTLRGMNGQGGTVRAIMPVHYAGLPCDMEALDRIATERDLLIVEDAAHAVPAAIGERMIGAPRPGVRSLASFSFYATKNLTTAEGGMLTGDAELLERARVFSRHGLSRDPWDREDAAQPWAYEVHMPGFKFNMTDLQAAIGLTQLGKLPDFHARRRDLAARYAAGFAGCGELQTPAEQAGTTHAWHLYALRLRLERLRIDRDAFIAELARRNIGASVHFRPIHLHPYYRDRYGLRPDDFPIALAESRRLLSLPLHPGLCDADVDDVIAAVLDIVGRYRGRHTR